MRKLLLFSLILVSTFSFSQAPQYLNYQGVARNSAGTVINSGNVGIRFEILQGSATGSLIYQEEMSSAPSAAGIFTTAIGSGTNTTGTFSSINWAGGPYFIRVSIDPIGGTSFSAIGTSQLLSVPYALYAEKAGNAQTFVAGTGITINSGTISATNQTVNINQSGVANVLGTYPNYTVDVPGPGLNYNSGTQVLTLTQGPIVSTATITTSSTSVSITGSGVSGSYPNYTITAPPATSITSTGSSILVTGSDPNFTLVPTPSLNLVGDQLSIADGNTVTLPAGTTYTNGVGIGLTSGTIITNSLPDQTVVISNGTNVTVNGTYPNFIVDATPSLSIAGNTLSITGGTSVVLPAPPVLTPSTGISINSGTITNTAPNQTVIIGSGTNVNVSGTYPNFVVAATPSLSIAGNTLSITGGTSVVLPAPAALTASTGISINSGTITNTAPNQTVNITGTGVSGVYPNYVVNSTPATSITPGNTNITVTGTAPNYTVSSSPLLTLAGTNLSISNGNTIGLPTYTAGNGLSLSGTSPNFTLSASTTGTNTGWSTLGNSGTNATNNFIGTTDNIPLNFRVNNQLSAKIDHLLSNAFFGYQTGLANTSGIFNAAYGNQALLSNTTGSYNAAFGTNALYFNTSGIANTATGYQPLYSNTNGNNNTANGYQSLYSNLTGSNNTALGTFAGYSNNGSGNVFLGYSAGYTAVGSNKLYIANSSAAVPLIYGDFASNAIGLGTTSPGQLLHLFSSGTNVGLAIDGGVAGRSRLGFLPGGVDNGEIGFKNNLIFGPVADATLVMGTEFMRITNTGKVGIGTNNPTNVLDLFSSGSSALLNLRSNVGNTQITMDDSGPNDVYLTTSSGDFDVWTGATRRLTVVVNGFVGIGTNGNTPTTKLNIWGSNVTTVINAFSGSPETSIRVHNDDLTNNNFSSLAFSTRSSASTNFESAKIVGVNINHTSGSIGGDLAFLTRDPTNLFERMRITSAGNVGIGTSAPISKLHVTGAVTISDGSEGIGRVLTSNVSGTSTWKPRAIGFFAGNQAVGGQNVSVGPLQTVTLTAGPKFFDDGPGYSTVTGVYTVPVSGVYQFNVEMQFNGSASSNVQFVFDTPGNTYGQWLGQTGTNGQGHASFNYTIKLNAGETVSIKAGSSAAAFTIDRWHSSFSGHLVYAN